MIPPVTAPASTTTAPLVDVVHPIANLSASTSSFEGMNQSLQPPVEALRICWSLYHIVERPPADAATYAPSSAANTFAVLDFPVPMAVSVFRFASTGLSFL